MIPLPIMLIHGFNGAPSNWTGPADRFPQYLAQHGFDPELVRVFSYGYYEYKGKEQYNNLGDMRQIAHRLDDPAGEDAYNCSIENLSHDSVARGGPPAVTIIAHSSGGLVARYYLTRRSEDEFGTRYRGNVARAIFLGTPHRGVDVEDLLDPLPTNLLVYRLMIRAHYLFPPGFHMQSESFRTHFRELGRLTRGAFLGDADQGAVQTPAFMQMHPDSPFLKDINRPGAMPHDVHCYNIVGDVHAIVRVELFRKRILHGDKSFGDFLVTTSSAGSIPNAPSECHTLRDDYCLTVDIGSRISQWVELDQTGVREIPIHRHLRSLPSAREQILKILHGEPPLSAAARIDSLDIPSPL